MVLGCFPWPSARFSVETLFAILALKSFSVIGVFPHVRHRKAFCLRTLRTLPACLRHTGPAITLRVYAHVVRTAVTGQAALRRGI